MKLPRHISSTAVRGTGLVRAGNIGALTNTGGAEFQAIQQAGAAIGHVSDVAFDIQQRKQKISDDTQTDKISQNMQIWANEQDAALKKTLIETPEHQKGAMERRKTSYDAMLKQELDGASRGVQRNIQSLSSRMYPGFANNARSITTGKLLEYTDVTETGMSIAEASAGDIDAANKRIDKMYANGVIGPKAAAQKKNNNIIAFKMGAVNSIKPTLEDVLVANQYAMKPANKAIDEMVGELQKNGTLNDVEAAEAKRDLSNWAADVAAQRRKQENQNAIQTQKGLADKLAEGTFTGDDVVLAGLTKAQIKDGGWDAIAAGARKEPPAPSYDGTNKATQAILDYAAGDIGDLEARDILMGERFKEMSISQDQYNFYLGKIDKKYPNHVASNISKSLSAAKETVRLQGFGVLFGRDFVDKDEKDDLIKLNNELLKWIDDESKGDTYPTGKAMYEKVRELGVPVLTPSGVRAEIPTVIPERTDPIYDPNDAVYDSFPSGTLIFDSLAGGYRRKP